MADDRFMELLSETLKAHATKLTEIQVGQGRIETEIKEIRKGGHERANNIAAAFAELRHDLSDFVPRKELEVTLDNHAGRLGSLESDRRKAVWSILASWIAGLPVAYVALKNWPK